MPLEIDDDLPLPKQPPRSKPSIPRTAPAVAPAAAPRNCLIPRQSMANWKPDEELQQLIDGALRPVRPADATQ